jgi:hypothetical protein
VRRKELGQAIGGGDFKRPAGESEQGRRPEGIGEIWGRGSAMVAENNFRRDIWWPNREIHHHNDDDRPACWISSLCLANVLQLQ